MTPTLYYALGGGLGHLTRARKVIAALGLDEVVLLTASKHARDPRVTQGRPVFPVPRRLGHDRAAFRKWLIPALREFDALVVDTFPGGVLGELCGLTLPPATLIARRLRWEAYARRLDGALPNYHAVYEVEALGVGVPLALPRAPVGEPLSDRPHTLVVHAGPPHELAVLGARARGAAEVIVVAPDALVVYPVEPHLAHAERIVSAAGFNIVHEAAPYRRKHTLVPFRRALDDQFARAAAASAELREIVSP